MFIFGDDVAAVIAKCYRMHLIPIFRRKSFMANSDRLNFIGAIHSQLKDLEKCPRQENENAPEATVEIFTEFAEGTENIKQGDELILFTWLHRSDRSVLKTIPRNDAGNPVTGVFSTRSPDRPNPIGIHFVKVTATVSNTVFSVSALEVLDGTPLIDIKPRL